MSNLTSNSLAQGVTSQVSNTQFLSSAAVLQRKICIIATYDPAKTDVVDNEPVKVLGAADCASRFGFGFPIHRIAKYLEKTGRGLPLYVIPQSEVTGAKATGDIDFGGSTGVKAGTLYIYIAGELVRVNIAAGSTEENIADAVVAAINANADLPVTAAKTAITFVVVLTAKMKGVYGNYISIFLNRGENQSLPDGVAVTADAFLSGGTGVPDVEDALVGLGEGDEANYLGITDLLHGYVQESDALDAISDYVGEGDEAVGCYDPLVHKPIRALTGDITAGSGGMTAIMAIGNGRKLDRSNGCVSVPGSINHPSEIAAVALGYCAKVNNKRAEENYKDAVLPDIWPSAVKADNWCSEYDNRDAAVKAGISPTRVMNGYVALQNVITFYHPDTVAQDSNGYRSFVSISKLQNIMAAIALNFQQSKWLGITIVKDKTKVTDPDSLAKARDKDDVLADYVALTKSFMKRAWIYDDEYSIAALGEDGAITVRTGGNGFDVKYKFVESGEGDIITNEAQFDISIAVIGG